MLRFTVPEEGFKKIAKDHEKLNNAMENYYLMPRVRFRIFRYTRLIMKTNEAKDLAQTIKLRIVKEGLTIDKDCRKMHLLSAKVTQLRL